MAVPKRKTSKRRSRTRRSHNALAKINISFDSVSGSAKISHNISPDGFYKGSRVIEEKQVDDAEQDDDSNQ